MIIQQFIEKAMLGGWQPNFREMGVIKQLPGERKAKVLMGAPTLSYADMLLDPLAWQAVGKVEGWAYYDTQDHFFDFANAIWKGKTIEEYLATL